MPLPPIVDDMKTTITNFIKNPDIQVELYALVLMFIIIFCVYLYIRYKVSLYERNCKVLKQVYKNKPAIYNIDSNSTYLLRDYYIKTAYNCCAGGSMKVDYVGLCALQTCIEQGVRCLDFQIYSINNMPAVAVSSVSEFNVKESFNSIPTNDVFKMINNMAFSSTHCPNPNDPLILHLRILSTNVKIYEILAKQITEILNSKILGVEYSFEFGGQNLGSLPIKTFLGKIIIIADASNPLYQKTKLDEYINIASGAPFMRKLRYIDVKFLQDAKLSSYNKQNMSIVLPDLIPSYSNPNFNDAREYGCQMVAMSFQKTDSSLAYYNNFFEKSKSAFVLKPSALRYTPRTITIPDPLSAEYKCDSRKISTEYIDFKI
jgi:hypothetical protein